MYAQFYDGRPFLGLPLFALVLFGIFFAAVIVRALLPGARARAEEDARLALDGEQEAGR